MFVFRMTLVMLLMTTLTGGGCIYYNHQRMMLDTKKAEVTAKEIEKIMIDYFIEGGVPLHRIVSVSYPSRERYAIFYARHEHSYGSMRFRHVREYLEVVVINENKVYLDWLSITMHKVKERPPYLESILNDLKRVIKTQLNVDVDFRFIKADHPDKSLKMVTTYSEGFD